MIRKREVIVALTADEVDWLEGAALRASEDRISRGLGTDGQLRTLAGKLRAALERDSPDVLKPNP